MILSVDFKKFIGCRIYLDNGHWDCNGFRTQLENLIGAWTKLRMDYGDEYLPETFEDFYRRNGKIEFYRMF